MTQVMTLGTKRGFLSPVGFSIPGRLPLPGRTPSSSYRARAAAGQDGQRSSGQTDRADLCDFRKPSTISNDQRG